MTEQMKILGINKKSKLINFLLILRRTEEKTMKRKITTADARRVEQTSNVLTGDWTAVPPEAPSGVRFYLCAREEGNIEENKKQRNNNKVFLAENLSLLENCQSDKTKDVLSAFLSLDKIAV